MRDAIHRPPPPQPHHPRKIFQIAAATEASGGDAQLYALCGDGTAWQLVNGTWHQLPEIPQPDDGECPR